jgi:hypothetical protein
MAMPEIVIGNKPKKNEVDFVNSLGFCISYYDSMTKAFIKLEPNN